MIEFKTRPHFSADLNCPILNSTARSLLNDYKLIFVKFIGIRHSNALMWLVDFYVLN